MRDLIAIIFIVVANTVATHLSVKNSDVAGHDFVSLPSYGEVRLKTRSSPDLKALVYLCASAYRDGRRALLYEVTRRVVYPSARGLPNGVRICLRIQVPYPKRKWVSESKYP